jgi:non-specific serine/threonine protein kinase
LPLALELAAPRLRALSAESLLERLDQRLPLLTAGRRDAPARQRTLRATIEWSYELLPAELRDVFAQLSIFAGTFSLEAAEVVTDATLDDVDALVEASLLKPVRDDRFLMLETIREFAREVLGTNDELARRHAEFLATLAERANLHAESPGPMRHDLVLPEADNIRAALQWTVENGRGELGLALAGALENYWVTSDPLEGRHWFEALLPLGPPPPSELTALARRCLGNCVTVSGDITRGQAYYEESAAEYRELGDDLRAAVVDHRIANAQLMLGNLDRAVEIGRAALATFEQHGSARGEAQVLLLLGDVDLREGRSERALELYARSLMLAQQTGFRWWEKHSHYDVARAQLALGRYDEAAASLAAGLHVAASIADRHGTIQGAFLLARVCGDRGLRQLAGVLYGAAEADVDRQPLAGWDLMEEGAQRLLSELDGAEFENGRAKGRTMSVDDAIARVVSLD